MIVEEEKASLLLPLFPCPGLSKRITPIIFGGRTDGLRTCIFLPARCVPSFPHRNFDRQLCSSIRREEERERAHTSKRTNWICRSRVGRTEGKTRRARGRAKFHPDIGRVEICQVIDKHALPPSVQNVGNNCDSFFPSKPVGAIAFPSALVAVVHM